MNQPTPTAEAGPAGRVTPTKEINLRVLLQEMIHKRASDLHVTAGTRAKIRIDGELHDSDINHILTPKDTLQISYSILTENQKKRFETEDELDFSFGVQNLSRFRGNVFKQRGCVAMAIRQIPHDIMAIDKLGLPPVVATLAERPRGLVLITGPTGAGKSTTLAALVDKINQERRGHIITIEDPIEFIHRHKKCMVNQREVGAERGCVAMAIRQIPHDIMAIDKLGLPPVVATLAERPRGLVLITGPTGAGKSTTLAALVDKINQERRGHIITIEDPIEFIHRHKKCMVNQREVGADTQSFTKALKYALRQDPDIILIGEMRDLETIGAALTIAETGHLVLATLHTNSAAESINRIIDAFPSHQQGQVRAQLAFVLEGVVTQMLLPKAKGRGRVVTTEVMICTPAIRAVIRDEKIHQIYSLMQAGKKHGMQTMNDAFQVLYMQGMITKEEALKRSSDPKEFLRAVGETPTASA